MGERASKGLNMRFSGGIRVSYQEKLATRAERAVRQDLTVKAFASVLSGVLGRDSSEEEILGLKPVTFREKLV